jgi:hypothetical protein
MGDPFRFKRPLATLLDRIPLPAEVDPPASRKNEPGMKQAKTEPLIEQVAGRRSCSMAVFYGDTFRNDEQVSEQLANSFRTQTIRQEG